MESHRLLIVVPVYASYCAFLQGLAAWLTERGWQVHVATNLAYANIKQDAAQLHDIEMPRGANPLQLLRAGRALTRLINEVRPTVVHAHFSVGMLCLSLASRVKGVRYLGTFQGMRFPLATGLPRLFFQLVECYSILRLDQSWVLTSDDYDAVPQRLRKKLAIQDGYGFGCDTAHFDAARFSDTDKSQLRTRLSIPAEAFVFIFVGRLTAFKGFHLALKAFEQLRTECDDAHFVVVGEMDSQHPLGLPDLNSIEGVHHLGWQEDPAPYLAVSNTMVFPSEREGMPVCVMEALSMGLCVLGNDARGTNQLLENFGGTLLRGLSSSTAPTHAVKLAMGNVMNTKKTSRFACLRHQLDCERFYETILSDYAGQK
jgi:glycosyltransferase involved in cell wall biosynthesis